MTAPVVQGTRASGNHPVGFRVNGQAVNVEVAPLGRLSDVLRDDLGLTGTKVGCEAGDCGACTIRLDGRQAVACCVPAAQADGSEITTVEGLAGEDGSPSDLQAAFLEHGAAQCGICTPGMLMAADTLLRENPAADDRAILDGIGGVLCRCTGYVKIVEAIAATRDARLARPPDFASGASASAAPGAIAGSAVGSRLPKVDGLPRVLGTARFGADHRPEDVLAVRAIRSPHARARFEIGDLEPFRAAHPGIVDILTAGDIPGQNRYGIYPSGKDQPALADGVVRHRGEAVLALVGDERTIAAFDERHLPIKWHPEEPVRTIDEALAPGAPHLHEASPGNILVEGRLATGDIDAVLAHAGANAGTSAGAPTGAIAEIEVETTHVEHAYIEPEAGVARRVGDRIELTVSTQAPYMDRDEVALILGISPAGVRIIPTACGGGFGGKLDLGVHPLIALAAWRTGRPCRAVWTRPESMAVSPKRHPARIRAEAAADARGNLTAFRFHGDFDTGAYASWGPTVANRVPVHAMGPYRWGAVLATTRAVYTDNPPAGAFRGFGVPQAAIAHEGLMDDLAAALGRDPLEFRLANALRAGDRTPSGQRLAASAGLPACLEALRPHWDRLRAEARAQNRTSNGGARRGVGIGAMWYGIGNTALANPSTIEMGVTRDARVVLLCGAVDIGQGASTVLVQIASDALGVPVAAVDLVSGDTDRTADAGKSSASRQTFVSGNAARLAGEDLRRQILLLAEVDDGSITLEPAGADQPGRIVVTDREGRAVPIELAELPQVDVTDAETPCVLAGRGTFDPDTTPLDGDGQGVPYQTYAFGAQVADVEVDPALGTVKVRRIVAAHDVGRAINPTQVEGQIHGGIAQGLGMALLEAYVPGRTENLHDYLIPTAGDMPQIECILVEDPEPAGPYGAKGVGEPALIPTAPAILGAIRDAVGVRITQLPATPDRVRAAIRGG
ncbi:MAG TPA: molybdopterin cofactor-binding domain-containing protein [Candidatus Limnocylindrales bacterium]|nr:molybdopterin cofactor-binding domain-containing protein [Candidatus Limnocylindrales bacterium]